LLASLVIVCIVCLCFLARACRDRQGKLFLMLLIDIHIYPHYYYYLYLFPRYTIYRVLVFILNIFYVGFSIKIEGKYTRHLVNNKRNNIFNSKFHLSN
jgi:hypothetical protein